MKTFTPLILASGLLSLAAAQVYPEVTPDDVDENTRIIWCVQQDATCIGLCQDQTQGGAAVNECSVEDLTFNCICDDNTTPNATEYSLAIPFNLCQQSKQMCVNNCEGDQACSDLCFTGKTCGATDPKRYNVTTTTSAGTPGPTASDGDDDDSNGEDDEEEDPFNVDTGMGVRLASFGSAYGIGAMVFGIALGFAGML
jgi:hypothetical protein